MPVPQPQHWRRQWPPTTVLLPGKSHGRRSLVGSSPWHRKESDTTKWLHFHFSLSCIGEGYGNPLQCSCLENHRDREAWWAAVYGVTQSQTRLKWLSSSSRDDFTNMHFTKLNNGNDTNNNCSGTIYFADNTPSCGKKNLHDFTFLNSKKFTVEKIAFKSFPF